MQYRLARSRCCCCFTVAMPYHSSPPTAAAQRTCAADVSFPTAPTSPTTQSLTLYILRPAPAPPSPRIGTLRSQSESEAILPPVMVRSSSGCAMMRVLVPPHASLGCPLEMCVVLENRGAASIEFGMCPAPGAPQQ